MAAAAAAAAVMFNVQCSWFLHQPPGRHVGSSRDEMGLCGEREKEKEERKSSDRHTPQGPPSHFWSFSPQLLHDAEGVEE